MAAAVQTRAATTREQQAAALAAELILFADGAEEAGLITYAQRARVVARETIWLADMLEAERDARQTLKQRNDSMLDLLANRVFCERCAHALMDAQ